jgi:hypothetical protein
LDKRTHSTESRRLDIAEREEALLVSRWKRWRNGIVVVAGAAGLGGFGQKAVEVATNFVQHLI